MSSSEAKLFIGLMSGTSMDAVDTVLVEFAEQECNIISYEEFPMPVPIQQAVRKVNCSSSLQAVTELDAIIGELFADSVNRLLDQTKLKPGAVSAIGSHGQTVLHLPGETHPRTLQIGDPNIIAYRTGITTVADFRRMDMAAGGQGAPLACAFHDWYFRHSAFDRVVLNIGGMANVTVLPAAAKENTIGFDTGPGNALMDDWTQRHLGKDYDHNGEWAAKGQVDPGLLNLLKEEDYFNLAPPKSTGKDDFNLAWLDKKIACYSQKVSNEDIQASLLELTAQTISQAINTFAANANEVLVCGGGLHNLETLRRLKELLPGLVIESTEKYGLDPNAIEAITFAWLAKRRLEKLPANLPSVTGATSTQILGAVYEPGSSS